MALNTDPVVIAIVAGQKEFNDSMAQIQRNMYKDIQKLEKSLNDRVGKGFTNVGDKAEKAMRQANQAATNLSFQLNDIGTSLAGGASPFMVMMQQGSQVAQVFQGLKNSGLSMGSALSAALGQVLNPMSLITFAVIGLTGVVANLFTDWIGGSEDAEEATKKLLDVTNALRASRGLKALDLSESPATQFIAMRDAIKANNETAKQFADSLNEINHEILTLPAADFGGFDNVHDIGVALETLRLGIKSGEPDFLGFAKTMQDIGLRKDVPQVIKDMIQEVVDLAATGAKGEEIVAALRAAMDGTAEAAEAAAERLKDYNKAMDEMAKIGVPTLTDLEKLMVAYSTALANADGIQAKFNATLLATKNLGDQMQGVFGNAFTAIGDSATKMFEGLEGSLDKTAALIREKERFSPKAYWDVNHWRVGFGSDKFVDEMGRVREVTQNTTVTLQQAEADLSRRIAEFQSGIQDKIGNEFWNSFNDNQKAALTSVAYNYGHLPDRVANAIKTGDTGQVAAAINALGTDNKGINAARRAQEAELFGGSQFDATPKKAASAYDDWTASIQKKTQAQLYENTVNADSTTGTYAKIYAIEKEKAVQEGLAAAKQQGLTVDAALTAQINASADAAARAATNQKLLGDATDATAKRSQEQIAAQQALMSQYENMASSALSGFINDLRHGVDAGEAFAKMIDNIIGQLIEMAVQALIIKPIFAALQSSFSLGAGVAKSGGTVGFSGLAKSNVSPAAFAGAPSMAGGGRVGDPNAIPIIAHRGEIIIPTKALRNAATQTRQNGNTNIDARSNVNVRVENGGGTSTTTSSSVAFGQLVDRTVQGIIVRESRPGGLLRQRQGAR